MTPIVSIIMPAYNAAPYIGAAITSILKQNYTDFELIIVNDGSTDKTVDIIKKFKDPRIILIHNQKNYKLPKSLNKAIDAASGKYIARSDADDINIRNRLAVQTKYLEEHQEIDVVGSGMYLFNDEGQIIGSLLNKKISHADLVKNIHWFAPPLPHPTIMAKASWLRKYRYNEKYFRAEDGDLFLRSYRYSRFAYIPEMLYAYRDPGKPIMRKLSHSNYQATLIRLQNWREYGIPIRRVIIYPLIALGRIYYHFIVKLLHRSQMWGHSKPLNITDKFIADQEWIRECLQIKNKEN